MRHLWLALLLPAGFPSLAAGQGACADIPKFFARPPRIGEWAEMGWQSKGKKGPDRMRVGVVGQEHREGRQLYWFQVSMDDKGKHSVMQMLTPWDVTSMRAPKPVELVMKLGDRPAMKMSGSMLGRSPGPKSDWREFCAKSKFLGVESVTVPAGTFKSRHYQSEEGDTWVSLDAPVWHLVKMSMKDGKTMVLNAKGTGAKNEITEKPQEMPGMGPRPQR
jgi:hypothetical protein